MSKRSKQARAEDTNTLKTGITEFIPGDVVPSLKKTDKKAIRGVNHPMLARLICPISVYADHFMDISYVYFLKYIIC